jgi:prolyl oligopeptidase
MDAPETKAWVAAENKVTDAALHDVPGRDAVHARIAALLARTVTGGPVHHGARYFTFRRDAAHDQGTVQVSDGADAPDRTLLDPSEFSTDGKLQLAGWNASQDGAILAYGLSSGGGDWTHWRFREVATGKDLPDELADMKYYPPAFTADHRGIYYSRFPTPAPGKELTETDHDCKLYFHRLGTPVAADRVVYELAGHPTWQLAPETTLDGRYLVLSIGDGQVGDSSVERIAILDLATPGAKIFPLVDTFDAEYVFVGNIGANLYFKTNSGAPTKKVVKVDVSSPTAPVSWHDVIAGGSHAIEDVVLAGDQILVDELHDAHTAVIAYDRSGARLHELTLPGLGSVFGIYGRPGDGDAYYRFTSYTAPSSMYRVDLATGATSPWRATPVGFDPAAYETRQVFFPSKDGTRVPMFITARKGLALDGSHPTLMTGYGGFGISLTPYFDPWTFAWIERGGVAVTVNIRGGGEYGDAWHHAGWHEHEQVKLDDFAAGAEWLIAHKWTSAEHLGAYGTSGGGQLVGAVVVQRPELFGAVAPVAGVLDLLRFQLFGQGAGWQADVGHPDVPAERAYLQKISPLHNVRARTRYPAMFVVTSDHDVRVPPLHSYKFAAALQAAQAGPGPILLRVQTESGHGGGGLKSQQVDQDTELLTFFASYLGLSLQQAFAGAD